MPLWPPFLAGPGRFGHGERCCFRGLLVAVAFGGRHDGLDILNGEEPQGTGQPMSLASVDQTERLMLSPATAATNPLLLTYIDHSLP